MARRKSLPELPPEIILNDILPRLDVKTLVRSMCVCKPWFFHIQRKDFIHAHHEISKQKPKLLCQTYGSKPYLLQDKENPPFATIPSSFFPESSFLLCSVCDGLLCIQANKPPHPLHLVNPATGRAMKLPLQDYPYAHFSFCEILRDPSLGVLKLLHMFYDKIQVSFNILTVGLDLAWRKLPGPIPEIPILPSGGLRSPRVNGAVHWKSLLYHCVGACNAECILAFDIKDEKLKTMDYPKFSCSGGDVCLNSHRVCLDEVDGCLSFIHFDICCVLLDVWVLKNYKNEVWSKEHSILVSCIPEELQEGSVNMIRRGANGEEILIVAMTVYWTLVVSYDLRSGTFRNFADESIEMDDDTSNVVMYEESLLGFDFNDN